MANENEILKGKWNFKDKIASLVQKDEKNDGLDSIVSFYPNTMITEQAAKAALNKLYASSDTVADDIKEEKVETPEEEYIWVEGYKGTDKDMKCRDYQFELGKKFDMPEGAEISICSSGFHLCPELKQVFRYYDIGDGNRFFKVMALVPKKQTEETQTFWGMNFKQKSEKYAAKEIIFMSECTPDEILNAAYDASKLEGLTDEEKVEALATSLGEVRKRKTTAELVALGYSEDIAKIAFENDREYLARALVKQTNISWDTRILALITSNLLMIEEDV